MPACSVTLATVTDRWEVPHFGIVRTSYAAGTHYRPHAHKAASLQVVVSGTIRETVSGREFTLAPGAAMFLPAGTPHSDYYPTHVRSLLVEVPERLGLTRHVAGHAGISWTRRVIRECLERKPGWELIVEGMALEALGRLERRQAASKRCVWLGEAGALARSDLRLSDIAKAVGRHPSHVSREFRRRTGMSLGELSRNQRLTRAAELLRDSTLPIRDVALQTGFCDQSHLTSAFRRAFDIPPGEFRRKHAAARLAGERDCVDEVGRLRRLPGQPAGHGGD